MLGAGSLLSWNAVLTALDYFHNKLVNPGYDPFFMFSLLMNGPNFFFTVAAVFLKDTFSARLRIVGSYIALFFLGIVMPFITEYMSDNHRGAADVVISIIIVFAGAFNAFL